MTGINPEAKKSNGPKSRKSKFPMKSYTIAGIAGTIMIIFGLVYAYVASQSCMTPECWMTHISSSVIIFVLGIIIAIISIIVAVKNSRN